MPDSYNASLDVSGAVEGAAAALIALQNPGGEWCFELEADATIPAEYILLQHYLGEIDDALNAEIAKFIRGLQAEHGGWPLFHGGDLDLSCSVKAYFALKAVGDSPDAAHMVRARQRLHPHPARTLRRAALDGRAGDAGRDHALAALVPVPSDEGVVLVADRDRAVARADGEEAARAQSPRHHRA